MIVIIGGKAGSKIVYDILKERYEVKKPGFMGKEDIKFMNNYLSPDIQKRHNFKIAGSYLEQENIELLKEKNTDYFVATGDNYQRDIITDELINLTGKKPINAIHRTAMISEDVTIGTGNLINAGVIINNDAEICDGTIINSGAILEHDTLLKDYCQVSPGCVLAGYVTVGKYAFVGAGTSIIPHIHIGESAVVAAGSAVTRSVKSNIMVAGCPAEFKKEVKNADNTRENQ